MAAMVTAGLKVALPMWLRTLEKSRSSIAHVHVMVTAMPCNNTTDNVVTAAALPIFVSN